MRRFQRSWRAGERGGISMPLSSFSRARQVEPAPELIRQSRAVVRHYGRKDRLFRRDGGIASRMTAFCGSERLPRSEPGSSRRLAPAATTYRRQLCRPAHRAAADTAAPAAANRRCSAMPSRPPAVARQARYRNRLSRICAAAGSAATAAPIGRIGRQPAVFWAPLSISRVYAPWLHRRIYATRGLLIVLVVGSRRVASRAAKNRCGEVQNEQ